MFGFGKGKRAKKSQAEKIPPSKPTDKPVVVSRPISVQVKADADPILKKRRRPAAGGKTRLMGFDTSDGRVVDLFDEGKATTDSSRIKFPVALVMIVKGPGLGDCFALQTGMSQIGRGDDQAVRLDYGDMAISRSNHAAIVYDPKDHSFLIGHGGKSNIVRLNGKPIVSTSKLKGGDEIEIGETRMRFVALCTKAFNWEEAGKQSEGNDDDDMEIA